MGHKKCKFSGGCLLTASFGYKDGTGTQFCSKHKDDDMINLFTTIKLPYPRPPCALDPFPLHQWDSPFYYQFMTTI